MKRSKHQQARKTYTQAAPIPDRQAAIESRASISIELPARHVTLLVNAMLFASLGLLLGTIAGIISAELSEGSLILMIIMGGGGMILGGVASLWRDRHASSRFAGGASNQP